MIKVFLGGYLNHTNAQNLNCRALATHLDRDKLKVSAMLFPDGNIDVATLPKDIKYFKTHRPVKVWKYITYLRGLLWCDIAYLPKGEIFNFCYKVAKLLGKKTLVTVEGVIAGTNYTKALQWAGSDDGIRYAYNGTDKTYSITEYMASLNESLLGIKSDGVLYLGVESKDFKIKDRNLHKPLTDIIFIGNNMRYKGIEDFLSLAEQFPDINFHVVGGGMGYDISGEIARKNLSNVEYYGLLNHKELKSLLEKVDLHFFPSRSEGFPKVTLETAAAGVPSIVYSDYGADEWITTGENGFVVNTLEEAINIVYNLKNDSSKLFQIRTNAIQLAESFDWRRLIKEWETVLIKLVN